MATFWKCSKMEQRRNEPGCPGCKRHASLHSGTARSCAACVSAFVWSIRQQDSKTRAAVLLTRALEKSLLLVTSQLFTRMEKCCGPRVLGVMIVHDTKVITQENVETMIQWKRNSVESSKKFPTESLRLG